MGVLLSFSQDMTVLILLLTHILRLLIIPRNYPTHPTFSPPSTLLSSSHTSLMIALYFPHMKWPNNNQLSPTKVSKSILFKKLSTPVNVTMDTNTLYNGLAMDQNTTSGWNLMVISLHLGSFFPMWFQHTWWNTEIVELNVSFTLLIISFHHPHLFFRTWVGVSLWPHRYSYLHLFITAYTLNTGLLNS